MADTNPQTAGPFLDYVRSPQFRTVFADGVSTVMLSDAVADRLLVSFLRFDILPIRERANTIEAGRFELIPNVIPETRAQKTLEVSLELRPTLH